MHSIFSLIKYNTVFASEYFICYFHLIKADGISLEQAKEIIKVASPILDTTLSESDIQDVMTFLDENQEANGYYYGDIGLLLLGKYKESYELMLKVE